MRVEEASNRTSKVVKRNQKARIKVDEKREGGSKKQRYRVIERERKRGGVRGMETRGSCNKSKRTEETEKNGINYVILVHYQLINFSIQYNK